MQIIIVDPILKNQSGHQFVYTAALQKELEKRGIAVSILGNISADEKILQLKGFYPRLIDMTSEIFNMSFCFRSVMRIIQLIRKLKNQFEHFFAVENDLRVQKNNVLFLHSFYIFELISFAWFVRRNKNSFIKNKHKVFLGFNFSYKRTSAFETSIFCFLYRNVFSFLMKPVNSNVIYFSDGEDIANVFEKLLNKRVYSFPVVINHQFSRPYINFQKKQNSDLCTISYIGGARYNKGFDIFVDMMAKLIEEKDFFLKLKIFVQIDVHKQQLAQERKIVENSAAELEKIAGLFKNITVIEGALAVNAYYKLISESDIIILPYRDVFKNVPSQVFRETIVFGAIPFVADNTTMAITLRQCALGDLIFNRDNITQSLCQMKKIVDNRAYYQGMLGEMQNEWARIYSDTELADCIMNFAENDKRNAN